MSVVSHGRCRQPGHRWIRTVQRECAHSGRRDATPTLRCTEKEWNMIAAVKLPVFYKDYPLLLHRPGLNPPIARNKPIEVRRHRLNHPLKTKGYQTRHQSATRKGLSIR